MQKPLTDYYFKSADSFKWGFKYQIPVYQIDQLLPLIKGTKILDVGCGPGHLVDALSKLKFDVTGIDITPEFIKFAQKNKKGEFICADFNKFSFRTKKFDTVILKSVLEHLENDSAVLKKCLKLGKRVILVVPQTTDDNLKNKGLIYSHYQDKSHQRTYTPVTLKKLIKPLNAKLVGIHPIEKLSNKSVIYELIDGPSILKRILIKLIFIFFKENQYYLELLAIIEPC